MLNPLRLTKILLVKIIYTIASSTHTHTQTVIISSGKLRLEFKKIYHHFLFDFDKEIKFVQFRLSNPLDNARLNNYLIGSKI